MGRIAIPAYEQKLILRVLREIAMAIASPQAGFLSVLGSRLLDQC